MIQLRLYQNNHAAGVILSMSLKILVKKSIDQNRSLLRFVLRIFYKPDYLGGRHFISGYSGYRWAIKDIWLNRILRIGRTYPWPACITCYISDPENIEFHIDDLNNFQSPGTYMQNFNAKIKIGKGSYIAPNVGLITANHDLNNLRVHVVGQDIEVGEECWIGMNAILLPGVILGPKTIVAAGSVVTKSFLEGNLVLAGSPAYVIKRNV